jgi:ribose transport system substrate-binding protein
MRILFAILLMMASTFLNANSDTSAKKKIVYIVSDLSIPFWQIMNKGATSSALELGYTFEAYSADNNSKKELELTIKALREKVDGIVISPTSSSACSTILKFAKQSKIPVVISDIGTDSGEYLSYISSNNKDGAYNIGKVLRKELITRGWENATVGIIAIPQQRLNGQLRTAGFMKALNEMSIKGAGIEQQVDFSLEETYRLTTKLINKNPQMRAIWLQGSDKYKGALQAIADAGKKGEILLITFDAEPEFIELIENKTLVGSAMQQPYLMGKEAIMMLHKHFLGENVPKNKQLPILAISHENVLEKLPTIKRNVLGIEE